MISFRLWTPPPVSGCAQTGAATRQWSCGTCAELVEASAIRRVVNLRLKAPGTFWLKEMAECFLFLRSQLLSGRWNIFTCAELSRSMGNLTALKRRAFWPVYAANQDVYDLPEAA